MPADFFRFSSVALLTIWRHNTGILVHVYDTASSQSANNQFLKIQEPFFKKQ